MTFDLVIVGAGTAGMPCAICAAERGASVVVVDKADEVGGTMHISGGSMSAAGARRQRERGIEDSPDRHFEDIMRISRGTVDEAIVRLAVDEAPATLDWLHDLGFPFEPETPALVYGHEPYSVPRTYWGPEMARSILETVRPVWDGLVADGRIELRLGTRMEELIVEDGAVVGILTDRGEVRGRAVVLTTGGYGANAELFAELTPGRPPLLTIARETSTGDGMLAAQRIGARIRGGDLYIPTPGGFESEPGSGRGLAWPEFALLSATDRKPREIHVNVHGERFRDEHDPSADLLERRLLAQPGHRFWIVFDEAALGGGQSFHRVWDADEIRRRADEGVNIWRADNVRGLAAKTGIDADGLERTVAEWNAAGPEWPVATPPFYAALTRGTTLSTAGGIAVDGELRVLDGDGRPIPNLYAAGEILGAAATMGDSKCGGMNVTPALSFGRILGRRLARAEVPA